MIVDSSALVSILLREPDAADFPEAIAGAERRSIAAPNWLEKPARLNFDGCMAYALAEHSGQPLLFKGKEFPRTDITPALP